ncbi:MAG: ATP-binding protein [Clostridiaceae bacterium]|nr:ATP-binding protein [Clostridiaceae bacterium]
MSSIRRNLDNEFALRRDKAIWEAERRKQEVYDKIPEIASIDSRITLIGLQFARGKVAGNSPALDDNDLEERINSLNKRKEELLMANNYPANYLEPVFVCPVCEDRGYIAHESGTLTPCSCYNKLYLERLYEFSNILGDRKTGFEFFKESYFSDKADRKKYGTDVSPRDQILSIKKKCLDFVDNINNKETRNMYFFGETGTGKTFMAKSTGIELMKKGYTVLYISAPLLFSIIHRHRVNVGYDDAYSEQAYKNLITANLLILDDLGTEPASDSRYAELLTLIELRRNRDTTNIAKTIISSNLDIRRLFQEYNERIASRIVGEFDTFHFFGDDIRIKSKIS